MDLPFIIEFRLWPKRPRSTALMTQLAPANRLAGAAIFVLLAVATGTCAGVGVSVGIASSDRPAAAGELREERYFDWASSEASAKRHASRRQNLIELLRAAGGGVFLTPSRDGFSSGETFRQLDDFFYFTGLELPNSVLAIDADLGHSQIFAPRRDARFENPARPNDFPGRPLAGDPEIEDRAGIEVRPIEQLDRLALEWEAARQTLWLNLGRHGDARPRESDFVQSWSPEQALLMHLQRAYPKASVASAFASVARLRMVKDEAELATIRRACTITGAGILAAASKIRVGIDERHLEAEMEAEWKRQGAQRRAFDSIIKSGPNSLWPWRILASHYDRRNRALEAGDLVIFDVGCELDHYASDVGRTFPASGKFSEPQAKRLRMVTAVTDAIIDAARPGRTLRELQAIAEAHIPEDERPHMQAGSFFGHHIGLNVGDPSILDEPLQAGMVFTVEPWYYNHDEGIAVFLEENIAITADGAENLTGWLPRTPEALERLVGQGN